MFELQNVVEAPDSIFHGVEFSYRFLDTEALSPLPIKMSCDKSVSIFTRL